MIEKSEMRNEWSVGGLFRSDDWTDSSDSIDQRCRVLHSLGISDRLSIVPTHYNGSLAFESKSVDTLALHPVDVSFGFRAEVVPRSQFRSHLVNLHACR
jgi:hypothetical protein